jgi:hypothetical protein
MPWIREAIPACLSGRGGNLVVIHATIVSAIDEVHTTLGVPF